MDQKKNHFKIFYSNPALNDLENIINYLNLHSTSAANEFLNHLDKTANMLSQYPRIGNHVKIEKLRKAGYRFQVLKHRFLLFYTIDEEKQIAWIKRVLHCAQDIESQL